MDVKTVLQRVADACEISLRLVQTIEAAARKVSKEAVDFICQEE